MLCATCPKQLSSSLMQRIGTPTASTSATREPKELPLESLLSESDLCRLPLVQHRPTHSEPQRQIHSAPLLQLLVAPSGSHPPWVKEPAPLAHPLSGSRPSQCRI